jgi:hypothetical protein
MVTDKPSSVEVTGVMLRNIGSDIYVEVEICGQWVKIIKESVADVGGQISHIVEPLGILNAAQRQEKSDGEH